MRISDGSSDVVLFRSAAAVIVLVIFNRVTPLGFLPGAFIAAPVAVVGAAVALRSSEPPTVRALARGALLSMPLVWVFQWTGAPAAPRGRSGERRVGKGVFIPCRSRLWPYYKKKK